MKSGIHIIRPTWDLRHVKAGFSIPGVSQISGSSESNDSPVYGFDMGINTKTPLTETEKNRSDMLLEMGLHPNRLAYLKQVHGNKIIEAKTTGLLGEADGLVTNQTDLAIGILVADCAAVLIADQDQRVIGAFHAGWRGAVSGILSIGIERMKQLGGKNFSVWISPCIGLTAFEVGDEVATQFPEEFVQTKGFSKPHVDLKSYIIQNLQDNGINRDRIFADERCTFENAAFYSYRRQGQQSGRMLAVIALTSH